MADHLVDTNVLSKFFFGDAQVKRFLGTIDAGVNTIIFIELIQGSIKKHQREYIKTHLVKLDYFPITSEISERSISLVDKYSSSHGLFLADALIAATALVHDLTLVTYNLKDFDYIKGLSVVRP